jgi:hypothetical protein
MLVCVASFAGDGDEGRIVGRVTDSGKAVLLEALVRLRPDDGGPTLVRARADQAVVDVIEPGSAELKWYVTRPCYRPWEEPVLKGGCDNEPHAFGCALSYTFISSVSDTCVYFCVVDSRAWPSSS